MCFLQVSLEEENEGLAGLLSSRKGVSARFWGCRFKWPHIPGHQRCHHMGVARTRVLRPKPQPRVKPTCFPCGWVGVRVRATCTHLRGPPSCTAASLGPRLLTVMCCLGSTRSLSWTGVRLHLHPTREDAPVSRLQSELRTCCPVPPSPPANCCTSVTATRSMPRRRTSCPGTSA